MAAMVHRGGFPSCQTGVESSVTLTIFLAQGPLGDFCHASKVEQFQGLLSGVLQTLLDLDPLMGPDQLAEDHCVLARGQECLMATPIFVIHILPNDSPILDLEGFFPENLICMDEALQDESVCQVRTK